MKKLTSRKTAPPTSAEGDEPFRDTLELSSGWYWEQDENLRLKTLTGAENEDARRALAEILGNILWDGSVAPLGQEANWDHLRAALAARQPFRDFLYCSVEGKGS